MDEPVHVHVVALDPMRDADLTVALTTCPQITVVPPDQAAKVMVLLVQGITRQVIDMVPRIRRATHRPKVLIAAANVNPGEAWDVIEAGASGLVRYHAADIARVARAIRVVASGYCTLPSDILAYMLNTGADEMCAYSAAGEANGDAPAEHPRLSILERAVLSLIADGRETSEIAHELHYSPRTVVGVVQKVAHRFQLRNRAHVIAYTLRAGLL